jgi:hypothetical protein
VLDLDTKYAASSRNEARKKYRGQGQGMSQLVVNLPMIKVTVRKEYLHNLKDGHGEFVEGVWVYGKVDTWTCSLF